MYRTIDAKFWTDPKIKRVPPDAKLLALYLVTNPHTHVSGIYYLPKVIITAETGIKASALDTLSDTLSDRVSGAGFACFDWQNEVVWVRKMFAYQGRGAKNEAAAAKHLSGLHNSPLIHDFLREYPSVESYLDDRVSIGYTDLDETRPPVPVPVLVPDPVSSPAPKRMRTKAEYSEDFECFWEAFPSGRKTDKARAWDAWRKKVTDPQAVIAAAAEYASSPVGQGQYVKAPTTWLNGGCWADDRNAWQRSETNAGRLHFGSGQVFSGDARKGEGVM